MNRFIRAGLPLILTSFLAAPLSAQEFPSPLETLELQDGDCVVFLGDSITHQCLYTQYVEDFFYQRHPGIRIEFHNAGVGGAKALDALDRFEADVAAYKPKYVTMLLGMNDGTYQPFNDEVFETYRKDMTQVIERIKSIGAVPVLMTPTMYDARAARIRKRQPPETVELYNSVLAYYGAWLRDVAQRGGHGFVDMYGPLNNLTIERREDEPKFTMIADAVHPGPDGQLVMAYAIIDDLDLRSPLSTIRIVKGPNGKPKSQVRGGELSQLNVTDGGLEFVWLAEGLPWVVPEDAQAGAKMLRMGQRASREAIAIHDLPAGVYELTIDGQAVGVYSAQQFAGHIELQDNPHTPQHQQAAAVAALNAERNQAVHDLRDEWRIFQQTSRLKRPATQGQENPQLAELEKKLEGLEERIADHQAAIDEFEEKIYEANQPKPRKYVLKLVETAEATGTVTLDGKPLAGAEVKLIGSTGHIATGRTDDVGSFIARMNRTAGVVPGDYTITITAPIVPARFSDPEKSGLTVRVTGGKNVFDFELKGE